MSEFGRVRHQDSEVHEVLVEFFPWVVEVLHNPSAPSTLRFFLSSLAKVDFLKNGIFDLCESDNNYTAHVVYRALIEHYDFIYVWIRYLRERSDDAASEYLTFCSWDEELKYGKAVHEMRRARGDTPLGTVYDVIRSHRPEVAKYSAEMIRAKAKEFSFPSLMKYLGENWRSPAGLKCELPDFLLKLSPLYSELCSFVHGRPDADRGLMQMKDESERVKDGLRVAHLSLQLAASVKLFLLLVLYQFDKKFGPPYNKIQCILTADS
jgi:hypothetical protein